MIAEAQVQVLCVIFVGGKAPPTKITPAVKKRCFEIAGIDEGV